MVPQLAPALPLNLMLVDFTPLRHGRQVPRNKSRSPRFYDRPVAAVDTPGSDLTNVTALDGISGDYATVRAPRPASPGWCA